MGGEREKGEGTEGQENMQFAEARRSAGQNGQNKSLGKLQYRKNYK